MVTLNLVNQDQSDIKYKISKFPDGQSDIVLNPTEVVCSKINEFPNKFTIKSRFNSFKDLEIIICATKALRRLGVKEIHLYIPYLLGARSDRQFQEGGNSYLVDVIAPILNAQKYESITVMDVHSDVANACINNLKNISNVYYVQESLRKIGFNTAKNLSDFILISPDGGSLKKIYKVAEYIEYKGDIICCSKSRDKEGKLSNTTINYSDEAFEYAGKNYIIIDDICDGGRTFIKIAEQLKKEFGEKAPIYLIITHGIFSAGFQELESYFTEIYCTNSYSQITSEYDHNYKIKQLNIF